MGAKPLNPFSGENKPSGGPAGLVGEFI